MTRSKWLVLGLSVYSVTTLISMATMSLGVGFLLVCLLAGMGGVSGIKRALAQELSETFVRRYLWIALFLTLACAISLIAAWLFPLTYAGKQPEVRFFKDMAKAWYLFWPWVLVAALRRLTVEEQAKVLRVWLGAFAVLSLIGVIQYFTGWPREQGIPYTNPLRYHATLFLGHHLSVASIFIFPFFAALHFLQNRNSRLGYSSRFLSIAVVFGITALMLTYSRMLWVALPVGLLIWAVWALPKKWGLSVATLLIAAGVGALQITMVRERVYSTLGVGTRTALWEANLEFLKERPLTGTGWHHNLQMTAHYFAENPPPGQPKGDYFVGHAHNNFIEMLGSTGLLGTLAWLLWVGWMMGIALKVASKPGPLDFGKGLVCAWIVFHINGLTQVNFWESKVLHQIMWISAFSLLWISQRASPHEEKFT